MDLQAMMAAASAQAPGDEPQTIDVSEPLGQPAGSVTLTVRELDAPRMFLVDDEAKVVRRKKPLWPVSLCRACALLGLAHVAQPGDGTPPLDFYVHAAATNRRLFQHILGEYGRLFPAAGEGGGDDLPNA